jgi:hypothetical protein
VTLKKRDTLGELMDVIFPRLPKPSDMYLNKCGCKVGTVCNNVACPHLLVVTC